MDLKSHIFCCGDLRPVTVAIPLKANKFFKNQRIYMSVFHSKTCDNSEKAFQILVIIKRNLSLEFAVGLITAKTIDRLSSYVSDLVSEISEDIKVPRYAKE